ncbi:MAG: transposase IS200-family protein [Candidatus Collierbacteria bacterium GW2011_GWD1_44_27]|nr:MAG: transposase IS200-family protein [Candidatus Collierbacteria bacterium GW2011_GWD1_44_27]
MIFDWIKTQPELHIETLNTDLDHIHLQIEIPPSVLEASVVQRIKWVTSIKLKKKFSFINKIYLKRQSVWSAGYFSSTVGLNEVQIREYIDHQGRKDKPAQVKLGFS